MNFKLNIFIVTAFAACVLILPPVGSIYAADKNMSNEKPPVSIDIKKTEVLSEAEGKKKRPMKARQVEEMLNKIESHITANNKSYGLIITGIFFAVLIYAFLALRGKEDLLVNNQNGMNSKKQ